MITALSGAREVLSVRVHVLFCTMGSHLLCAFIAPSSPLALAAVTAGEP